MVTAKVEIIEPTIRERVADIIENYAREISLLAEDEEYHPLVNRSMLIRVLTSAHNAPPRARFERFEESALLEKGQINKWLDKAGDPRYTSCTLFKKLFYQIRANKDDNLDEIVINHAYEHPEFALQVQKTWNPHIYGTHVIEKNETEKVEVTIHTIKEIKLQVGQNVERLREHGYNADGSKIASQGTSIIDGEIVPDDSGECSSDV